MARYKSQRKRHTPQRTNKVYTTPQKSKVQGAVQLCRAKGIPMDVGDEFGVEERPGYKMIEQDAPSRTWHNQGLGKTRGRKLKITPQHIAQASEILEDMGLGIEAKGMHWKAIIWDIGADVKQPQTIRKTIREASDYGKYKSALKEFMDEKIQRDRLNWADVELVRRPTVEHFRKIRYSDEFHAGFGPEEQLWIIRRRGTAMRYRPDNIQHRDPPPAKLRYKVHGWAAVGYDFKIPKIIWYTVSSNENGAITQDVYINEILEVEVKMWLERGDDFIL
ncbi:MAG: hypothetical protein L6R37_008106 [Teloschistes peruensis]|nr:MAG: hypothetical protein L6R37_008106 [Teloschistes peruensis]